MEAEYVVGVDLGGTKIATALCDDKGNIIAKVKMDTRAYEGVDMVIQRIKASIWQVLESSNISISKISGIGIAAPGPLSVSEGKIIYAASLGWRNVPICDLIYSEFKIFTCLENDANAAAYGEALIGAGKDYNSVVYITVSTGIGCGIIINKEIYHGKHDSAGELGHICIEYDGRKCSCGNKGCLQAYASGTAIKQLAEERIAEGNPSVILELSKKIGKDISADIVEKAAREGDKLAMEIWSQVGRKLGQGISILMQILDPDIVVIGGGVMRAWDLFYQEMVEIVKKQIYECFHDDMVIVPAKLGEEAGIIGVALITLKKLKMIQNNLIKNAKF